MATAGSGNDDQARGTTRIRSPIVTVLGHVDHGKTSLLDRIRGSIIAEREAGHITQNIGATLVPSSFILKHCRHLLEKFSINLAIPGLLFIDTPGHKAFTTLRKRGGALADLAILVVDVRAGFQPQTIESIKILTQYKTPFIVAANKIDLISGWSSKAGSCFLDNLKEQDEDVLYELDQKIYSLLSELSKHGYDSERYDRISDFTKQIAIIPVSAKTGEGISDCLSMLAGIAQRFLTKQLEVHPSEGARGTVLEVLREKGLGTTLTVIIYDGMLRVGDDVVVGGMNGPIKTKIRALLRPKPLEEMRANQKFESVEEVVAASGIKLSAPGIDEAIAGAPVRSGENAEAKVKEELEALRINTENVGVIVKADSLGSLEAMAAMLKDADIPIRSADIGDITRKDIVAAQDVSRSDKKFAVVFGFNSKVDSQKVLDLASVNDIRIIEGDIIYKLIEVYDEYVSKLVEDAQAQALESLPHPARLQLVPGCIFRQSKPAIVGVEVVVGTIVSGTPLMKGDGQLVGRIKQVQVDGETVPKASRGKKCAIAIDGPVVGRTINENETLFTWMTEDDYRELIRLERLLSGDEKQALSEIASIMRSIAPSWGMIWGKK